MIDLIVRNQELKEKSPQQYKNAYGDELLFLSNISKVNILIGKNNSGKSRFMRTLLKDEYKFCSVENNTTLKNEARSLWRRYSTISFEKPIKECIEKLKNVVGLNNNEICELFWELYTLASKATATIYTSDLLDELGKIINLIKIERCEKMIYIPILRGIEKFSNTVNKFMAEDDSFRLTEGERKNLNSYIGQVDEVYFNKVKKNYFSKFNFLKEIHTGEYMYDEIQQMLLGKEEGRKLIKAFEEFLSKNFFENKPISLIPNIKEQYLYINIDGEEYELHNLGEGIKQLIIITYKMFINKDKKVMLFIEEPELNLHPGLQRKLIELMLSDEFVSQQYFITTHSNHLIDLSLDYNNMTIFRFEKDEDKRIKIEKCSKADNKVLQVIGAKPSSIFNSNCTIWVEGITDRLYIRKFLELYQKKMMNEKDILNKFREDIDYSFVEYSGGNITHWNFISEIEEVIKINAKFLSQNILVIADNDFPNEGEKKALRLKELKDTLKENFYKLPVREIENLLTKECLLKIIRKREKDENAFFKPDFKCDTKKYIEGHIGKILDESVQLSNGKSKHKYTYSGTNALYNKVDFCNIAISCIDDYEELSDNAKELTEIVFDFISKNNK